MTAIIKLTKGAETLVDDDDYHWLSQRKWHRATKQGYAACRMTAAGKKKGRIVYMHRLILSAPDNVLVDHINGDKLDNRRVNLRLATWPQQNANKPKHKGQMSRFKGIFWHPGRQKWYARISTEGRRIHLGVFDSELEAALAYNEAAREHHGEYARVNAIEDTR